MRSRAKRNDMQSPERLIVRQNILDAMQSGEDLGLDYRSETYRLYRDVYLSDLESIMFPNDLTKSEWDRRMDFVENNRLNFL